MILPAQWQVLWSRFKRSAVIAICIVLVGMTLGMTLADVSAVISAVVGGAAAAGGRCPIFFGYQIPKLKTKSVNNIPITPCQSPPIIR